MIYWVTALVVSIMLVVFGIGYITGWIIHSRVILKYMEELEKKRG